MTLKLDSNRHEFRTGTISVVPFSGTAYIPPKLQQLTIRTAVNLASNTNHGHCKSCLPVVARVINLFISSPQYLVLDVNINLFILSDLIEIDSACNLGNRCSVDPAHRPIYSHNGNEKRQGFDHGVGKGR